MAHVASPRRTWRRAKPTRFHAGIRYRRGRDALNREGTGTALTMELREVGRYERHGGGLLLPKHIPAVARRRLAWPDAAFTCTDNRWTWPGVARCRPSLAPNLAPRDILSAANLQRRGPRTSIRRWGGGWMPTTSPLKAGLSVHSAADIARIAASLNGRPQDPRIHDIIRETRRTSCAHRLNAPHRPSPPGASLIPQT